MSDSDGYDDNLFGDCYEIFFGESWEEGNHLAHLWSPPCYILSLPAESKLQILEYVSFTDLNHTHS